MSHVRSLWIEAIKPVGKRRYGLIAALATIGILAHLLLRFGTHADAGQQLWPLWLVLLVGGVPLSLELLVKLVRGQFGSDLLAGISIVNDAPALTAATVGLAFGQNSDATAEAADAVIMDQ